MNGGISPQKERRPSARALGEYVFQVEMCYASERLGLRIQELPIYFEDRRIGQSKISVLVKLEAALRVFEIWWRYHGREVPVYLPEGGHS